MREIAPSIDDQTGWQSGNIYIKSNRGLKGTYSATAEDIEDIKVCVGLIECMNPKARVAFLIGLCNSFNETGPGELLWYDGKPLGFMRRTEHPYYHKQSDRTSDTINKITEDVFKSEKE